MRPADEVIAYNPRRGGIDAIALRLGDCDVIHVLESEVWLNRTEPGLCQTYADPDPRCTTDTKTTGACSGCSTALPVVFCTGHRRRVDIGGGPSPPSLETMQFAMTKVDVLRLMVAHRVPHVPTFVLERPTAASDGRSLLASVRNLLRWLRSLAPAPIRFVTKPSHSGSCERFRWWNVAYVTEARGARVFAAHLRSTFEGQQKPYLLVQPYVAALAHSEYRHFFVGGRFLSCVHTRWHKTRAGTVWRLEATPAQCFH
jgi:hypothetical protein